MGATGGTLNIPGDLVGRSTLLFDRGGNVAGDPRNLTDGLADFLDRGDGILCRFLHASDMRGNFAGRLRGLACE